MSFGIHIPKSFVTARSELELTAEETENTEQDKTDAKFSDQSGRLQTGEKSYVFKPQSKMPNSLSKSLARYASHISPKNSKKTTTLPSPMQWATKTYQKQSLKGPSFVSVAQPKNEPKTQNQTLKTSLKTSEQSKSEPKIETFPQSTPKPLSRKETKGKEQLKNETRSEARHSSLQSREWKLEKTTAWWNQRYTEKERDGQGQGQQQDNQDEQQELGICGISAAKKSVFSKQYENQIKKTKPQLSRPQTGIFALYYILTKIGITSDSASNFSYKKEIESVDLETTEAHKQRLEELKVAIEKEKSAATWGIMNKVFSWIGSCLGIIAGVVLIATGVGAVAGAMMIAGGLIQITNQILELTGGWRKIAALLPGNDPEQKRAVLNWMQIGISVLCLILSGVGVVWGGISNFGEAMSTAQMMIGAIATLGASVTTIGEGINTFLFKDKMSEVKRYEMILAELKHKRRNLMEKVEWGIDRLEQLFEDLARALEFEEELFRSDQMVNR